jgi:4-amino-4-deoxy-L-arabinose transferase-like glycosyltransferase
MGVLRRLRAAIAGIPAAGRWCATIAFLNVVVWAAITPPFHVPDENAHVAYVQHLAENGEAPDMPGGPVYSSEETRLLERLLFPDIVGRRENNAIWFAVQDEGVRDIPDSGLPRDDGGGTDSNSNQPPLFFALDAGVYLVSPWDGLLERLALMRLVSALFAGLTTLFTFLFLRELLAERWTWTVGALAVAFQPMFGFISGGVTPDSLLFATSAALFFALARAFRSGLTGARGVAIGAILSIGLLTKLTFAALVPGALIGLGFLIWRSHARPIALRAAAVAVSALALASVAYVALNLVVWDRSAWGGGIATATASATETAGGASGNVLAERAGYTWQLYLPRLPFMNDQFAYFPPYDTWFKGTVGLFGWLDTPFPAWVYTWALVVAIPVALLALLALFNRRATLLQRWPEHFTYLVMIAGLLVSIGVSGFRYRADTGSAFEQARYLFPLLPLYGAGGALAALGAGRRLARPVGAGLVVLALAHSFFAQLVVIGRFYA